MKIKIIYTLFLASVLGLSSLTAQDVVISYETLSGLNGKNNIKVYMQSTTANDVEIGAVNLSFAHAGTCLDFNPTSSVFTNAWTSFLEKECEVKNLRQVYNQHQYDKRLQYGNAEPGLPTTQVITIPANTQPKLLVMEIEFKGACGNAIYMEDLSENPVNQIGDEQNRSIPYIIEHNHSISAPVQWVTFSAVPVDRKSVAIEWETANETESLYFEVEKSFDNNFFQNNVIEKVAGAGTTTENKIYSLVDKTEMAAVVYYRLKHIDNLGAFTYSQTVMVSFAGVGELPMSVAVYPNPVVDKVTVSVEDPTEELHTVQLVSMNGSVLFSGTHDFQAGEMNIDMSRYAIGIYTIEVKGKTSSRAVSVAKE